MEGGEGGEEGSRRGRHEVERHFFFLLKNPDRLKKRTKDVRKIAAAISDSKVSYQDILAIFDAFMSSIGKKYKLKKWNHPSFIEGRVAKIMVENKDAGMIGEIHPQILQNWKLEMPVAVFELEIEKIMD